MVTIYHNPACGTSRKVLALLEERGASPQIVEYLKAPLSKGEILALVKRMNSTVRALLRDKAPPYEELGLAANHFSEEQLAEFMQQHPILMNRPVVVTKKGAKLCRPAETVLELL